MASDKKSLLLIIPVYNDWESVAILIAELSKTLPSQTHDALVVLVNDGSTDMPAQALTGLGLSVEVVHLQRNLGHQKAIAIGLAYAAREKKFDNVIVMDSDGEDKPEDCRRLLELTEQSGNKIAFAHRSKRNEGIRFIFFYRLYKFLFRLLTGIKISFGNFCIIPHAMAVRISYMSEIWNHFTGGIIKSKLPYVLLSTERGKRYRGHSKMNLQSLVMHGLSSVSVHIDTVSVRLLLASILFLCASIVLIVVAVGIRLFTDLAIPGWTSNIILGLTLVFLQALFLSVLLVFITLSYRTQKGFVPAADYKLFISHIDPAS